MRAIFLVSDGQVLTEQLRLLLQNVTKSVIPRFPLVALLLWSLTTDRNAMPLRLWAAAVIASKLIQLFHARHVLAAGIPSGGNTRLIVGLLILQALDGALWGSMPWLALDMVSVPQSVMVLSILAVVTSNAMSVLSPVPLVFTSFALFCSSLLSIQLWRMDDSAYQGLIVGTFLFVTTLFFLSRNGALASRAAIMLRFENLDLIERLRLSQREAEEANLAKSKFLAAASHDLRQPVHSQGLLLEVLSRTGLSDSQREVIGILRSSADATRDMLNTLLDFSRIEAGVIEPGTRSFHLQPMLNRIEHDLAQPAVEKGLVYRSRDTHAAVHSDPALVELIVRNLVSNAIRYTERGGLLVGCRRRADAVVLEVWDTGIGIAPAHQHEIFREFHQLGNPERDRRKGLGLGLAIADGLARALRHKLELSSVPGRGTVFRLTLPLASDPIVAREPAAGGVEGQLRGVHALILDDDDVVRAGMQRLLTDWGCQCVAVESGEEAIAAARVRRPDVVISDYRLREHRTGAHVITALRAEFGAHLPALLITGDTGADRLREARASNIPLLHKPLAPDQLYARLADLLKPGDTPPRG